MRTSPGHFVSPSTFPNPSSLSTFIPLQQTSSVPLTACQIVTSSSILLRQFPRSHLYWSSLHRAPSSAASLGWIAAICPSLTPARFELLRLDNLQDRLSIDRFPALCGCIRFARLSSTRSIPCVSIHLWSEKDQNHHHVHRLDGRADASQNHSCETRSRGPER